MAACVPTKVRGSDLGGLAGRCAGVTSSPVVRLAVKPIGWLCDWNGRKDRNSKAATLRFLRCVNTSCVLCNPFASIAVKSLTKLYFPAIKAWKNPSSYEVDGVKTMPTVVTSHRMGRFGEL